MRANKALVQLTAAMASAALPVLTGRVETLGPTEWVNVAITMAGVGSVFIATNLEDGSIWSWAKAMLSGISAGLVLLVSYLTDSQVTVAEWTQVGAAALATLAVALVSNDAAPDTGAGRHRSVAG